MAALRALPPGVVHPGGVERQVAATVHDAQLQVGQLLEDTAVDQSGRGDRRLQRVPDDVGEVVVGQALAGGEAVGVDQHHHLELGGPGEERPEAPVVEIEPVDVGADLHSPQAELGDGEVEFGDGDLDVLEGHGGQPGEPVGVLRHELGQMGVLETSQPPAERRIGPVIELRRRHREHLAVDAHAVHVLQPADGVGELRAQGSEVGGVVGLRLPAAVVAERIGPPRPEDRGEAEIVHQLGAGGSGDVAVDVDDRQESGSPRTRSIRKANWNCSRASGSWQLILSSSSIRRRR